MARQKILECKALNPKPRDFLKGLQSKPFKKSLDLFN